MSTDNTIISAPAIPTLQHYTLSDVDTVASILHGEAWASLHEECGGNLGQCEITEVMPSIPAQAVTLALWVLVQAEAAGDRPDTTPAADIGFSVIGSGGGSGAPVQLDMIISYHYYLGDDAQVYLWCEARPFGDAINNECMGSSEDFDIPEQVVCTCTVTYDVVDEESAREGDAAERGFIVDGNDIPSPPIMWPGMENWRIDNKVDTILRLPLDADELVGLARGRSVMVRAEQVAEADATQSQEDGSWRSETLHIEAGGDLAHDDVKAWVAAVKAALRIR